MNKYIIKNCPCYWHIGEDDGCSLENMKLCEDDTDCKLKQIVELCKSQQQEFDEEIKNGNYPDKYKFFKSGRADAGTEILQLLDIQEVE